MAVTYNDTYSTTEPRLEKIYPPGCLASGVVNYHDHVTTKMDRRARNDTDSRPFPEPNPTTGWLPETGLAKQWEISSTGRRGYRSYFVPCPHGGIHGEVEDRIWLQPTAPGQVFSAPSLDLWSLKMRQKIEDDIVNLGTSLAEYKASAHMFGSFAKGMYDTYKVLRGRKRRKRISPCAMPAAHLQYSYGVGPLASDLFDAAEALRLKTSRGFYKRFHVKGKENYRINQANGYEVHKGHCTVTQYATFKAGLSLRGVRSIQFGNPVEWAWELIPFSFVVDWGIPIGEWLHSLDALDGISEITGTVSTKEHLSFSTSTDTSDGLTHVSTGKTVYKSHERGVYHDVPIPPRPKWEPSQSYRTVANGLALLGVLNKRCNK